MSSTPPLPPLQPSRPEAAPETGPWFPWLRWVPWDLGKAVQLLMVAVLGFYLTLTAGMVLACVGFTFAYLFGAVPLRCEVCP